MASFLDRYAVLGILLLLRSPSATAIMETDATQKAGQCPGSFTMDGHGPVSLVSTGWNTSAGFRRVAVTSTEVLHTFMESRSYFGNTCTEGPYDPQHYMKLNLLNKTMRYHSDLSGAGCGCNAAFYLTSLGHNPNKSQCYDYYCDANNVCGESCTEIDIQEGNIYAWHSTLHTAFDHSGKAAGYGGGVPKKWNGPRQWTPAEYGPGAKCVDTNAAFEVAVSFPTNSSGFLTAMAVTLTQERRDCSISVILDEYEGMAELTHALKAGMTPIVSYWASDDMIWLDGVGKDNLGTCGRDNASACPASVLWWGFVLEELTDVEMAKARHNVQEQYKRYPTTSTATTSTSTTTTTQGSSWWERPATTRSPWRASTTAWLATTANARWSNQKIATTATTSPWWTTTSPWWTTTSPWWTPPQTQDTSEMQFMKKFTGGARALFAGVVTRWPFVCASGLLAATLALGVLAVVRAARRSRDESQTPSGRRLLRTSQAETATSGGGHPTAASRTANSISGLRSTPSSVALLDLEVSGTSCN